MTDVELDDGRDRRDRTHGLVAEAVTRMTLEAERIGMRRRLDDPLQLALARLAFGFAVSPRVEFHHRRAERAGGIELPGIGVDEERDPDLRAHEVADETGEVIVSADRVETALGGELRPLLRHDAGGVRL